jgi:hypothetical protein
MLTEMKERDGEARHTVLHGGQCIVCRTVFITNRGFFTSERLQTCLSVNMSPQSHVCVHTHIYTHTDKHTHTHTHTHTGSVKSTSPLFLKWRLCSSCVWVQLKCDGTRWRKGGEVKGKLANGVGSQYPSHCLGTWCTEHYYRWCAHLGCQ